MYKPDSIAGAIIAGGHSRRFGQDSKALACLAGTSLIEHVYRRLKPQTERIWLNIPQGFAAPNSIDAYVINDATEQRDGPLPGVLSALNTTTEAGFGWLLIAPCDTPFIPNDLGKKLLDQCIKENKQLGIASSKGWNHPSVSIWNQSLLPSLAEAVLGHSKAGFKQFYPEVPHCFLEWPTMEYDPFFNINTPDDLEAAADIINNYDI